MEPYNFSRGGVYTTSKYVYTTGAFVSSTTTQVAGAETLSFSCSSRRGNFIDATPLSFSKLESAYLKGTAAIIEPRYTITRLDGYGCGGGPVSALSVLRSPAPDPYNKCLGKLYDQIRSGVDLSIDLCQGRQTVKMVKDFSRLISHPLQVMVENVNKMFKSQKPTRATKLAGNKWLEWQYGVMPTVNTIYDLTGDLIGNLSSPEGGFVAKARATEVRTNLESDFYGSPFSGHSTKHTVTDSRRAEIALHCVIANAERNALSQFTSLNPVSFFYENIPFSFVLDWVYDVGGYIRSMETALATGLEFRSGYVTKTRKVTVSSVCKNTTNSSGRIYLTDLSGKSSSRTLDRALLTGMPLPIAPSVDVNLGSARLLSAASLLTNLLSTSPSKRR